MYQALLVLDWSSWRANESTATPFSCCSATGKTKKEISCCSKNVPWAPKFLLYKLQAPFVVHQSFCPCHPLVQECWGQKGPQQVQQCQIQKIFLVVCDAQSGQGFYQRLATASRTTSIADVTNIAGLFEAICQAEEPLIFLAMTPLDVGKVPCVQCTDIFRNYSSMGTEALNRKTMVLGGDMIN
eukprot:2955904-Ditylum_brightwellii.AAC.3